MSKLSRRTFVNYVQVAGTGLMASRLMNCKGTLENGPGSGSADSLPPFAATELSAMHFDLSFVKQAITPELQIGGERYPLQLHTAVTRAQFRKDSGLLTALGDSNLTHFAPKALFRGDSTQSFMVTYAISGSLERGIALGGIHIPTEARRWAKTFLGAKYKRPHRLGLLQALLGDADPAEDGVFANTTDAAIFLVYHHPDIIALEPTTAALILNYFEGNSTIDDLAKAIGKLGAAVPIAGDQSKTGWARAEYQLDGDGKPLIAFDDKGDDIPGQRQWTWVPDASLTPFVNAAVRNIMTKLRDDPALDNKRYGVAESRAFINDTPRLAAADIQQLQQTELLQASAAAYEWSADSCEWNSGQYVDGITGSQSGTTRKLEVNVYNSFSRYLAVYAAFADASGTLGPRSKLDKEFTAPSDIDALSTSNARFLGILTPPTYFFGAKVTPYSNDRFTIDKITSSASYVVICNGSIRWGRNAIPDELKGIDIPSIVLTSVLQFGIPTILLAYGAYSAAKVRWKSLSDTLITTGLKLVVKVTGAVYNQAGSGDANWVGLGTWLATEVLKRAFASEKFLVDWIAVTSAGSASVSVPILGWGLFAVQVLEVTATISQTTVDMVHSQTVVRTAISSSNKVKFTFSPQNALGFPALGVKYRLILTVTGGNSQKVEGTVDKGIATLVVTVPKVISGGSVAYKLELLAANGTYVAGGVEGSFFNTVAAGADAAVVSAKVKNAIFELKKDTKYRPAERLDVFSDGKHRWIQDTQLPPGGSPRGTCGTGEDAVCIPGPITLSARTGQVAYGWKMASPGLPVCGQAGSAGTAVFSMQNLNRNVTIDNQNPDATLSTLSCGTNRPIVPVYCLSSSFFEDRSYVLDPSKGIYHLRAFDAKKVSTGPTDKDPKLGVSWGKLASNNVTAAAMHKSGRVLVVSADSDKLELLVISGSAPTSDATAPQAAITSGSGTNVPGNISKAVGVCALSDADIFLVLENGNKENGAKRIQAFGTGGQPHPTFLGGQPYIDLNKVNANRDWLDICYDGGNKAIYLLSRTVDGAKTPESFAMDIITLGGSGIVRLPSFPAARFTLDDNQNVFAVDWRTLRFKGLPQPGVTIWNPVAPGA